MDNSSKRGRSSEDEDEVERQAGEVEVLLEVLTPWKHFLLVITDVLQWTRSIYPVVLSLSITITFLLLWYLQPSVVTLVGLSGLAVCVLDFGVPTIGSLLIPESSWSKEKETKFQVVCIKLVQMKESVIEICQTVLGLRTNRPSLYFSAMIAVLMTMMWIGSKIDNGFLTYLLVLGFSLTPGLIHHGFMYTAIGTVCQQLQSFLKLKVKAK